MGMARRACPPPRAPPTRNTWEVHVKCFSPARIHPTLHRHESRSILLTSHALCEVAGACCRRALFASQAAWAAHRLRRGQAHIGRGTLPSLSANGILLKETVGIVVPRIMHLFDQAGAIQGTDDHTMENIARHSVADCVVNLRSGHHIRPPLHLTGGKTLKAEHLINGEPSRARAHPMASCTCARSGEARDLPCFPLEAEFLAAVDVHKDGGLLHTVHGCIFFGMRRARI